MGESRTCRNVRRSLSEGGHFGEERPKKLPIRQYKPDDFTCRQRQFVRSA